MVQGIRGAVRLDEDTEVEVSRKSHLLISKILAENRVDTSEIVSIQFTQTVDLRSLNSAAGLRRFGFDDIPLFCAQEPVCEKGMPMVIRALVTFNTTDRRAVKHVYLNGAEKLRPDLA